MLINEQDERLIQRCVDEELSVEETRTLLQRLDRLDNGWKKLACELLEDRSLKRTLGTPVMNSESRPSVGAQGRDALPLVPHPSAARTAVRHWWSHPVTSLTLCAAIAFAGGLLIPDVRQRESGGVATNAASRPSGTTNFPVARTGGYRTYPLQMAPGGETVEIPGYSQLEELYRQDRQHPIFAESVRGHDNSIQWIIVPVEENKSMLIPVSQDTQLNIQ